MNCIERKEIEEFVKGKLAPQQMLAVDSHIGECAECKKLAASLSSRAHLASALVGAADCPDYEELSAYLDENLDAPRMLAISNHANLCELCSADLGRTRELRSHAALRQRITMKPGGRLVARRGFFIYWKQALALTGVAAVIAVALIAGNIGQVAKKSAPGTQVAVNPTPAAKPAPVEHAPTVKTPAAQTAETAHPQPVPENVAMRVNRPPAIVPPPSVLKDGRYSVIRRGDRLALARADGESVGSKLEARLAAKIQEKLSTGKVKLANTAKIAMGSITVRSGDDTYEVRPSAPKPSTPINKNVLSAAPTFTWAPVDLAESYRVCVYDAEGKILAEQETNRTSLTLSKSLARGKAYTWRVGVRFGEQDSWTQSGPSAFYVVSSDDCNSINSVRTSLHGSHLAMGVAYESAGLYDEAAGEYRLLRRQNPNSKLAKDLLYSIAKH